MLRQELLPPKLDSEKVSYLEKLAEEVIRRLDSGENYLEHISEFNHLTGKTQDIGYFYYIGDFDGATGSMGMRTFVERALMPPACRISDVTDDELLEMLKIFQQMNPAKAEWDFFRDMLAVNIPNPNIITVIAKAGENATEEEILMEARKWKPIQMPPSSIFE